MENVGFDPDIVHANVHTKKYNHIIRTNKGDKIKVPDLDEDFHVFSMEWDANEIRHFVDGKEYFAFKNEHAGNDTWPFDHNFYLILNLAIGVYGEENGVLMTVFSRRSIKLITSGCISKFNKIVSSNRHYLFCCYWGKVV